MGSVISRTRTDIEVEVAIAVWCLVKLALAIATLVGAGVLNGCHMPCPDLRLAPARVGSTPGAPQH
jgi:hypothetical protein